MSEMNSISLMTEEMYRWFRLLNEKFFGNTLEEPVITIQKTRANTYGYFTVDKVWHPNVAESEQSEDEAKNKYEICISALGLNRTAVELVHTLQHELVHYKNACLGIKDCSGANHNKKFKSMAEQCGLVIPERSPKVGWGFTEVTEEFVNFVNDVIKPDISNFTYYRVLPPKAMGKPKKKKEKFEYTCPNCGNSFILKKGDLNLLCGDCDEKFEVVKVEEDE